MQGDKISKEEGGGTKITFTEEELIEILVQKARSNGVWIPGKGDVGYSTEFNYCADERVSLIVQPHRLLDENDIPF